MTTLAYRKRQQELETRNSREMALVVIGTALLVTWLLWVVLL